MYLSSFSNLDYCKQKMMVTIYVHNEKPFCLSIFIFKNKRHISFETIESLFPTVDLILLFKWLNILIALSLY